MRHQTLPCPSAPPLPQYDNKGMSSQINDNVVITKRPSTCANAAKPANFKLQSYATPWPANWP